MKIKTRDMILVALFAALTAVGAFIKVPLPYVPFTLQFFFCAFAGILLGSRLGALSQLIYVIIGLCGIPVFAQGGGPGYIFQPTFGYLIGFILGAYAIGKVYEILKKPSLINLLASTLTGLVIVFLIGVPYLYMIYNLYLHKVKPVSWAINYGLLPFLGGDIVLCVVISILSVKIIPILKKANLV
jgi:biotin transport system substrate-specific component